MSHVCIYGPSPTRPWNSRSRSVPFSHCCSCFLLVPTQRLCPRRAIDFSRVISVFPFMGRKWNNNRGGRENHGVTLGETVWVECKIQNGICEAFLVFLTRYLSRRERPEIHLCSQNSCFALTVQWQEESESRFWAPSFTVAYFSDTVCPNMRKLCWNPRAIFLFQIQTGNRCSVQHCRS